MILGDASRAHRLLHNKVDRRIFDSIDALHAFYRIPKCLNWWNIISWIPFGSDLDPNSDNVFFPSFFKGERIQISLKAGHHRPASEAPLNGISLACRCWPNVECWLVSFENFRGSGSVLLRNPYFCDFPVGGGGFGGGPDPPVPPLDPRMGPDNVYTYWDILKTHFIVRIGFCTTLCVLSIRHKFLNGRNILSWIPSGLIWIQTVFANLDREKERETGICTSFRENQSTPTDRQGERERERRVFFLNFVSF